MDEGGGAAEHAAVPLNSGGAAESKGMPVSTIHLIPNSVQLSREAFRETQRNLSGFSAHNNGMYASTS